MRDLSSFPGRMIGVDLSSFAMGSTQMYILQVRIIFKSPQKIAIRRKIILVQNIFGNPCTTFFFFHNRYFPQTFWSTLIHTLKIVVKCTWHKIKFVSGVGIIGQQVKLPPVMRASHMGTCSCPGCSISSSAPCWYIREGRSGCFEN